MLGAFLEGWRRALGAPAVTASLLAATCFLALPLAMALRATLELQSEIHYELRIVDEATLAAERARELGRLIDGGVLRAPDLIVPGHGGGGATPALVDGLLVPGLAADSLLRLMRAGGQARGRLGGPG